MVTHTLWKTPGISRVEIARRLNLYRSTVSNIINILIRHGVVVEEREGAAAMSGGRRPICLELNRRFGCVLGLELRPSGYYCVLVDMAGKLIYTLSGLLPDMSFDAMADAVLFKVYGEVKQKGIPLLAVCMAVPGVIDAKNEKILESHPFALKDHRLRQTFSRRYNIPVFIENDANCLAWLELSKNGDSGVKNFMCINLGSHQKIHQLGEWSKMGIGIGLALDGFVFPGNNHRAGEFLAPSWRGDTVGQTGLMAKSRKTPAADEAAFKELVAELFSSLISVVSVLDPGTIFLYGELVTRASLVNKIIQEEVPQFNVLLERMACDLVFTRDDDFAAATGAAMMYFLHLFSLSGYCANRFDYTVDWDTLFALASGEKQHRRHDDLPEGLYPPVSQPGSSEWTLK
ncbi:MAG: ROK family transcriptional regulator [Treponema sp.]|jgi:predicted NBD/HSP70 family sugar kinase|nr:ROK family transcriptional regulator [Treponema sp.]